jgi:hypothetical protein
MKLPAAFRDITLYMFLQHKLLSDHALWRSKRRLAGRRHITGREAAIDLEIGALRRTVSKDGQAETENS